MDLLSAMRVYIRVVERGSISRAARDLNMGQSSVSERIDRLEKYLGTQLLLRSARVFSCTEEGKTFYEHSKQILDASEEAIISVTHDNKLIKGTLRIAAPHCFGEIVLPEALMAIRSIYPQLHLDVVLNDKIVDPVTEGVDISLRLGQLNEGMFIAYKLGHVNRVLVAAPNYLKKHGPINTPFDLAAHPFIRVKGIFGSEQLPLQKDGQSIEAIPINTIVTTSHWRPMYQLLVDGEGIGVLQEPASIKALERGKLVELLPQYSVPSFELNALIRAQRPIPKKVRAIIDILKQEIPRTLNSKSR
ncbi:LysR family transcriptional regulator [Serratia ureilytica]|uniref:LysR family transcriptional regulator n=1 Tax=Serratia ureilytica TaxID=300181 RepID=UPI0011C9E05B|nr:LysR family transcriptional regulator [Serratia ureilytica]MBS7522936.1 LysR family transcriptional regulator [Serratia ureilytica]TXE50045.1 LysR family transcriptional regulator [Serratia ureilytica]